MTRHQQIAAAMVLAWVAYHLGKKNAIKASTSPAATVPTAADKDPLSWLGFQA